MFHNILNTNYSGVSLELEKFIVFGPMDPGSEEQDPTTDLSRGEVPRGLMLMFVIGKIYPLRFKIAVENHHAINGKIHYFYGHFP